MDLYGAFRSLRAWAPWKAFSKESYTGSCLRFRSYGFIKEGPSNGLLNRAPGSLRDDLRGATSMARGGVEAGPVAHVPELEVPVPRADQTTSLEILSSYANLEVFQKSASLTETLNI